jgi:hypothetical protein
MCGDPDGFIEKQLQKQGKSKAELVGLRLDSQTMTLI